MSGDGRAWWPWVLGAGLLGILGAMLWRRRQVAKTGPYDDLAVSAGAPRPIVPDVATPPAVAPVPASTFIRTRIPPLGSVEPQKALSPATPAQAPRPAGIVSTRLRASIALELIAEAAVLDEQELAIQFELRLSNTGSAPARDVVVEALLLNAGENQDAEIATFFARADPAEGAIDVIGPLDQRSVRSVVRMPRSAMREYLVDGRRLLVPVLAFNAGYRFGSNTARCSGAWLIGRGGSAGIERLGPLRLDQGPRRWTDLSQKRLDPKV